MGREGLFSKSDSMKKIVWIALIMLYTIVLVNSAYAKDLTFSTNQSEYYFNVKENAVILLEIDNSYGKTVDGMLTNTVTQQVKQGSFQYSNTNSQSKSFSIQEGKGSINLNLGTSDTPATLKIKLDYAFDDMKVDIDELVVHFVEEESQKQNKEDPQQASCQKNEAASQQGQQSSEPSAAEQMQKALDELMKRQPDPQSKLQNNQMSTDSSALKQQMQKQQQQQQELKEKFQQKIADNPEFQQMHNQLEEQGYKPKEAELDPTSEDTGSFDVNYESDDGRKASISGKMEDGEMKELQKQSDEDKQQMLENLRQDERFAEYQQQLANEGFNQSQVNFEQQGNHSSAHVEYTNKKNQTANISAEFEDRNVTQVNLEKESQRFKWEYILVIPALLAIAYFLNHRTRNKPVLREVAVEKPFDYVNEARKLISRSRALFEKRKHKDAYGTAAQGLRLFLRYENNVKAEKSNFEILSMLDRNSQEYPMIKKCFDLCSLVEFAKYKANKKDFEEIVRLARGVIRRN
jgi:hypothetical protein